MVKFGGKIGTLYQIFTPCTPCKIGQMFKRKGGGGGQRPFEQCSKKLHFSLGMASLRRGGGYPLIPLRKIQLKSRYFRSENSNFCLISYMFSTFWAIIWPFLPIFNFI